MESALAVEPAGPVTSGIGRERWWSRKPDQLVAIAATIFILFLHAYFTPNLGGLWRDEVNTVNLATLPSWSDVWQFHNQDSFPLLFASVVRVWSGVFGSGDDSLRLLGLLAGLGVVAALWISARLLRLPFPFWSLILVGANPMIIRYGDSVRAYGISLMLLLLMYAFVWKVVETSKPRWLALATITSVFAVHAVYYNAVLLFAICMGGCVVTLREKRWRTALAVLGIGFVAALSMLPYAPVFLHANDWNFLVQYGFTMPWMWKRLSDVTGSPHAFGVIIWTALVLAALVVAASNVFRSAPNAVSHPRTQLATFCAVTLVVGIIAYAGFLKLLSYFTQPWYYVSLVTFVGLSIDPILSPTEGRFHRPLRAIAAALFLIVTAFPAARIIGGRHTNVDRIAATLESLATADDLILVTRWECGVTMKRYYKGVASWTTIPPLSDFRFQAYQPVMEQMKAEAPLQPVFERAAKTLQSGNRVWLVGQTPTPPAGQEPPVLPRVRAEDPSWRGSASFYIAWVMQVTHFLNSHITKTARVPLPAPAPVGSYEDLPLTVIEGWQ